ncbi:MAG TPA: FAD-binding oxidoreductase, partial [Verrucomicrobiae bacterium]
MASLRPSTVVELAEALSGMHRRGEKLGAIDLGALARVLEHSPEDMTVTVEAGLTLAALQSRLAQHGQWLPIDPPKAATLTIADLLNEDRSGPRRFGYGTIREHLIGLQVVLADGRVIRNGGKVVKNVAGYDLCKLFVGARGTIGIIVEATFKLRPLPQAERVVTAPCDSSGTAAKLIEAVLDSELTPTVLDLHSISN